MMVVARRKSRLSSIAVQCSHATTMSATHRLNCLIEDEAIVFSVTATRDDEVSDLKKAIQIKRALGRLKGTDPHTLELWKVSTIDEPLREMTLLFSAQGLQPHHRRSRRHSPWTYRGPGTSFRICGQIRRLENRLEYLSNTTSQRIHPHNCKGPGRW